MQESIQREAQTFRAAPALKPFLTGQAAADIHLAAFKEQIAVAQAHIAPLIASRWKEDQERTQRLVAFFQPRIDPPWTEAQERLQTLWAPLKAMHERVREALQLFQQEVLQGQKKLQEFAAPFKALAASSKAYAARLQPGLAWIASEEFLEEGRRISAINTIEAACCPLSRERYPEAPQEDRINAAMARLIAYLHPGLRNPRAAQALRQKAAAQHTSPQHFLRTEVFPTAIWLVARDTTSNRRIRVGREWITNMHGKVLVASPDELPIWAFHRWFFSQVYGAATAIMLDEGYPRPVIQQAKVLLYEEDALKRLIAVKSSGARDSMRLTPLLQADEMDRLDQLHRIFTVASPREKELLILLEEGCSRNAAAQRMGIKRATVDVLWWRIRKKVRSS
jgi:hypothetical protein